MGVSGSAAMDVTNIGGGLSNVIGLAGTGLNNEKPAGPDAYDTGGAGGGPGGGVSGVG